VERDLNARILGGHGRRGRELKAEAWLKRCAIDRADERLCELDKIAAQREPIERAAHTLADDRARERSLPRERDPRPERSLGLDRGR
jgi:hypothetical protein